MKKSLVAVTFLVLVGALAAVPATADSTLYDNTGPISDLGGSGLQPGGYWDALAIYGGVSDSDSFSVSSNSTVTSIVFDVWLYAGDSLTSVDWSIGTTNIAEFGGSGTTVSAPFLSLVPASNPNYTVVDVTYDVDVATISGLDVPLTAGTTYWLTLQNSVTSDNNVAYWDLGNGPSDAWQTHYGDVNGAAGTGTNSETFQIIGNTSTSPVPEPNSLLPFATGLTGLLGLYRRKFAKALQD